MTVPEIGDKLKVGIPSKASVEDAEVTAVEVDPVAVAMISPDDILTVATGVIMVFSEFSEFTDISTLPWDTWDCFSLEDVTILLSTHRMQVHTAKGLH